MSDILYDINKAIADARVEVLDVHTYMQIRCRCERIYALDLSDPYVQCKCGLNIAINAMIAIKEVI
jgi:hypothetical protein